MAEITHVLAKQSSLEIKHDVGDIYLQDSLDILKHNSFSGILCISDSSAYPASDGISTSDFKEAVIIIQTKYRALF